MNKLIALVLTILGLDMVRGRPKLYHSHIAPHDPIDLTAVLYETKRHDDEFSMWSGFIQGYAYISAVGCEDIEEARVVLRMLLREEMPGAKIKNEIIKKLSITER